MFIDPYNTPNVLPNPYKAPEKAFRMNQRGDEPQNKKGLLPFLSGNSALFYSHLSWKPLPSGTPFVFSAIIFWGV